MKKETAKKVVAKKSYKKPSVKVDKFVASFYAEW